MFAHDQHDPLTARLRNRLTTTGIGLGLVRLLLDAGLTEDARTTLASLQAGLPDVAAGPDRLPLGRPARVVSTILTGRSRVLAMPGVTRRPATPTRN